MRDRHERGRPRLEMPMKSNQNTNEGDLVERMESQHVNFFASWKLFFFLPYRGDRLGLFQSHPRDVASFLGDIADYDQNRLRRIGRASK